MSNPKAELLADRWIAEEWVWTFLSFNHEIDGWERFRSLLLSLGCVLLAWFLLRCGDSKWEMRLHKSAGTVNVNLLRLSSFQTLKPLNSGVFFSTIPNIEFTTIYLGGLGLVSNVVAGFYNRKMFGKGTSNTFVHTILLQSVHLIVKTFSITQ